MRKPIGAVRVHNKGYLQVKTRTQKTSDGKHCWEYMHRIVMELMIGRPLENNEMVHHTDGHKDNNHPNNLELCIKQQPPGQRVSDLLVWAKDILSRYGHLNTRLDSIYY